ncbi:MAG: endonuclease/exonuclease/phosphatase family protein [Rhodobacteraceae bacterium]|nr:endonuclease/exonuclease/phosphatase family protein [Paracoccaceae bacterium]
MARSSDPRNLTFGTFNLYNLQSPGKVWRGKTYSEAEYRAKIAWSAEALRRLDADVIGFQELWSPDCLHDLFDMAQLSDSYELIFIKDSGEGWYDIAVSAALRKPWIVRQKRLHKNFGDGFRLIKRGGTRDPEDNEIRVQIDIFSRTVIDLEIAHPEHPEVPPIRCFFAHLKSKLSTRLDQEEQAVDAIRNNASALGAAISTIRRTAEAAALRDILGQALRDSDTPVVLVGDLNDGEHSNTVAILTEQPSYRLFEGSRTGFRSDRGLYAASRLQAYRMIGATEHTHEHDGEREILDHVLVSEQFYDHSDNRLWSFEQMRIWNDHVADTDPASSDHGQVAARFLWDPTD